MKKLLLIQLCIQFIFCIHDLNAQENEKLLLSEIIENFNSYKDKSLTLKLRFRNIDTNFNKIVFYDRKNTDIDFDISDLKKLAQFDKLRLNLHEGLEYYVTFKVSSLTSTNNLTGELKNFQPVILSKILY